MKNRNAKIELLRIIAMVHIIAGHALGHGGLCTACMQLGGGTAFLGQSLETLITPAVNILVIISGYFGLTSRFNSKKIITLYAQVFFYSVTAYVLFAFLVQNDFSIIGLIKSVFPITFSRYWFFSVYICLYLFSPFLNALLLNLTKAGWQCLLGLCFIFCSLISSVPGVYSLNPEGGNGIIWFAVLYATGGYLKKYPPQRSPGVYICIAAIFLAFSSTSVFGITYISNMLGFEGMGAGRLSSYTSFPIYFASIAIVQMVLRCAENDFNNVKIKRLIAFFSSSTFSIYLLHENPEVRQWLWGLVDVSELAGNILMIISLLTLAIVIFLLCAFIDKTTWCQINRVINRIDTSKMDDKVNKWIEV